MNKQAAKSAAKQLGFIILVVLCMAVLIGSIVAVLLLVNYHPAIGLPLLVVAVLGGLGIFLYLDAVKEQEYDAQMTADAALFEEKKLQRQSEAADFPVTDSSRVNFRSANK